MEDIYCVATNSAHVKCWESKSIEAGGKSRKDGWLTPMSSFDVGQGGVDSGPGGRGVLELVWTGPGFSLCAAPLESSGPGFCGLEQRLGEQAEVQRFTGPEMSERT